MAQVAYATCSDFCANLSDDLQPLYLLAFLLTGNHIKAEQCYVVTVGDAVSANGVFKGWERSWNKRCLIINAIRLVFSAPAERIGKAESWSESDGESRGCSALAAVTKLAPPFLRFVFIMSVLERYSEHECALLLGCTPRAVFEARIHAFWQLSGFNSALTKTAG
jgi:hypothetical protein